MNKSSKTVTEIILEEKLDQLEGKIDKKLDQLEGKIDKKLDQLEGKIDKKLDIKLEEYSQQVVQDISSQFYEKFEEVDEKFERLMTSQDKIIGKLENWEIENTVGTEHTRELRVEVDDHEIRLKKLETSKN